MAEKTIYLLVGMIVAAMILGSVFSSALVFLVILFGGTGLVLFFDVEARQQVASLFDSGSGESRYQASGSVEVGQQQRVLYGNLFAKVGDQVDFWSDLIEGESQKVEGFRQAYAQVIKDRKIKGVSSVRRRLTSSGALAYSREFEIIQRGITTAAVYIESLGEDLYISWRLFAKRMISSIRVGIWLVASLLLALPFGFETECSFGGCRSNFVFGNYIAGVIGAVIVTGLLIAAWGFFFHRRDAFSLLRESFNELQQDDIESLGHVVHKSVLAAADVVGIDSELLMPREPLGSRSVTGQRRRQRRI